MIPPLFRKLRLIQPRSTSCRRRRYKKSSDRKRTAANFPLPRVTRLGFEPRLAESESAVLPLHHQAICVSLFPIDSPLRDRPRLPQRPLTWRSLSWWSLTPRSLTRRSLTRRSLTRRSLTPRSPPRRPLTWTGHGTGKFGASSIGPRVHFGDSTPVNQSAKKWRH